MKLPDAGDVLRKMKMMLMLTCLLLLVGCKEKPVAKDLVEPGNALGGVRLGMTREELSKQLGTPKQAIGPDRNGLLALAYPGGFTAVCDSNSVVVAVQAGGQFTGKTKEGIGIGSPKADVVRMFGVPDKTESNTDTSEFIYYKQRGVKMKIGTNGNVEHITIRPKQSA